jgi:hypothetical protein
VRVLTGAAIAIFLVWVGLAYVPPVGSISGDALAGSLARDGSVAYLLVPDGRCWDGERLGHSPVEWPSDPDPEPRGCVSLRDQLAVWLHGG